jgi:hypothetical protein
MGSFSRRVHKSVCWYYSHIGIQIIESVGLTDDPILAHISYIIEEDTFSTTQLPNMEKQDQIHNHYE